MALETLPVYQNEIMPVAKNWEATAYSGTTGNEIKVQAEVSNGSASGVPHLRKRSPQGFVTTILQLDLINAGAADQENFRPITYVEKIGEISTYTHVELFYGNDKIEGIPVQITGR